MAKYSKFEILEAVVKATREKAITIDEIEKQLKKLKATDDGGYDETVKRSVVDHFKLKKDLAKGDKAMINFLTKRNKELTQEIAKLRKENGQLKAIRSIVDQVSAKSDKILDKIGQIYDLASDEGAENVDVEPNMDSSSVDNSNWTADSSYQHQQGA